MILTCPECDAQYFADDASIGESGRTVKCASCGHSWFVDRVEEPSLSAKRAGAHETYRAKVRARRRKKSQIAARFAWATTGTAFAIVLAALVLFRNQVADVWPQSASAFQLVGLEVNRFRIEFRETEAERFFDGTTPILEVRGAVENVTNRQVVSPNVRVTLLNDAGIAIAERQVALSPATLEPRGAGQFVARIENPPFEAFELDLSFSPVNTAATHTAAGTP